MSVRLQNASSQIITATPPPTSTQILTVGVWVYTTNADGWIFSLLQGASDQTFGMGGGVWTIWGGATQPTFGTVTANNWYYVVVRIPASNNKRMDIYQPGGTITHGQNTDAVAITPGQWTIGADGLGTGGILDGSLSKLWIAEGDIQPDGLALNDQTLRQLAYQGPFSLAHVASKVIEYRSFRGGFYSSPSEDYFARYPRTNWVNAAGSVPSFEPPIAGNYVTPQDMRPIVPI